MTVGDSLLAVTLSRMRCREAGVHGDITLSGNLWSPPPPESLPDSRR